MRKFALSISLILLCGISALAGRLDSRIDLNYFSEQVSLPFSPLLLENLPEPGDLNENSLERYFQMLPVAILTQVNKEMDSYQQEWQLNDYLRYQLLHSYCKTVTDHRKKALVLEWALLRNAGFEPLLLSSRKNNLQLFINSADPLAEACLVEWKGNAYYRLAMSGKTESRGNILTPFVPKGREFAFRIEQIPHLPHAHYRKQSLKFKHGNRQYRISYRSNQTWVRMMHNYPALSNFDYVKVPLDQITRQDLHSQLLHSMQNQSPEEQTRFLLSFVRSGFSYQSDQQAWEVAERPLTAEELLFFKKGDCEDLSALYFQLQKDIVGLPMIVMDLPQHLTVATALPLVGYRAVSYEGRDYYFTEPTNSGNHLKLGELPHFSPEEISMAGFLGSWRKP